MEHSFSGFAKNISYIFNALCTYLFTAFLLNACRGGARLARRVTFPEQEESVPALPVRKKPSPGEGFFPRRGAFFTKNIPAVSRRDVLLMIPVLTAPTPAYYTAGYRAGNTARGGTAGAGGPPAPEFDRGTGE